MSKLKTLRDLVRENNGVICDENTNEIFGYMGNKGDEGNYFILPKELKAEAVNHIKQFEKDIELAKTIENLEWVVQCKAKIDYITWNNNLTEEDLMTNEENAREHGEQ